MAIPPASDKALTPAEIESRQDAVLRQLEALERRIAQVLAENGVVVELPAPGTISPQMAAADPAAAEIAAPNGAESKAPASPESARPRARRDRRRSAA